MELKPEFAAVLFAAVTIAAAPTAMQSFQNGLSEDTSSLKWDNEITVYKNGDQVDQIHNTLTDQGKKVIAGLLFDDTLESGSDVIPQNHTRNITFIALANGTGPKDAFTGVEENDKSLDNEIDRDAPFSSFNLSRNESGSITTNPPGTYKLKKSFTSNTAKHIVVNGTGLYFNSTGPSLVSGGAFTGATLKQGDTITVTHEITIRDGG
jgi:hypothetical protein